MGTVKEILIHLENWDGYYPPATEIIYNDGDRYGEYCHNIDGFKDFFEGHKEEISKSSDAEVIFKVNLSDLKKPTVIKAVKEIQAYLSSLIEL